MTLMRLFHWYLHYIYDLILYLCIMYYTVCYLTGIFYAVVRQIFMLFIDNKISVFCVYVCYFFFFFLSLVPSSASKISVRCLRLSVLFYICVGTASVDLN